jgi:hypothetical protein
MDINRNNYENYFLLYIDNELSAADNKAVEAFVLQHTDLQQELTMLQQSVLKYDPIVFEAKDSLLKIEETTQEKLLLYLDGELNAANTAALNEQLLTDNILQQEWTILQRTKLPQNSVIFENKELLLRKEPARIIVGKWWRVAAAAFVGFGLLGSLLLINKNNSRGDIDVAAETKNNVSNTGTAVKEISPSETSGAGVQQTATTNTAAVKKYVTQQTAADLQQNTGDSKNGIPGTVITKDNAVVTPQNFTASSKEKRLSGNKNTVTKEYLQNFNNEKSNELYIANVTPTETISQPAATEPIIKAPIKQAALLNIENTLNTNNASFAINIKNDAGTTTDYLTPDEKKNKRSGLIRKVSRFLQRSTKKKADGDGLKIAGFEFAVR